MKSPNWEALREAPPSPLEAWPHPLAKAHHLRLWIKRDDQLALASLGNDRSFCGNKWRKLKYNLLKAQAQSKTGLLTFGGAYSNHLAAVAAAGYLFGFETIGIVRGERPDPLNPTLAHAALQGMQLFFVSRSDYRLKDKSPVVHRIIHSLDGFYMIPEGGTNELALQGCQELGWEITRQMGKPPDYLAVSMGTGGTAAGLIRAGLENTHIKVYPALKGHWMEPTLREWLAGSSAKASWEVVPNYHLGGFARFHLELVDFIRQTNSRFDLPLDPIYTGKLFRAVLLDMEKKKYTGPADLVIVHTGGLQGRIGFEERYHCSLS